jgi:hypothetical protein
MKSSLTLDFEPTLVLYHANCADGFGAAWAIYLRFGDRVRYEPATYGQPPPSSLVAGERVVMVDVSFPRADIERLSAAASQFFLVDHHASAYEDLAILPQVFFDLTRSGAGLAWDMCHPSVPRPLLIDLIEDRDLWNHRMPQTKWLCVLDSLPFDFSAWDAFSSRLDIDAQGVSADAVAITRFSMCAMDRVIEDAVPIIQAGKRGWAVNAPHDMSSEICARLCQRPNTDFGFSWFYTASGEASCSWRSKKENTNVIDLARQYGGGGHPVASGARLSMEMLGELLDSVSLPDRLTAIDRQKHLDRGHFTSRASSA